MHDDALFVDVHYYTCRKHSENVCGDAFASKRFDNEGRLIAVLSDGLGSGVKANILACMTAQMALRFVSAGAELLRSCEVMMESLPVCQVRKISYATFTIIDCDREGLLRVVEEGNPNAVIMRGDIPDEVSSRVMTSKRFPDRHMRITETTLRAGDRLVACSDGVTQSGTGTVACPTGWGEIGLRDFLAGKIRENHDVSSRDLARAVVEEAMEREPDGRPQDDTSCMVVHFREPRRLMVLTGPPYDQEKDAECAAVLDMFPGRKAVCGGTTANLIAREWGVDIWVDPARPGSRVPPGCELAGVDLATEGILTLTEAAVRLEAGGMEGNDDAADRLVELFLDSDAIDFLVGTRLNDAHQDPDLPGDLETRRTVVKRIADTLRDRYLKRTTVRFL